MGKKLSPGQIFILLVLCSICVFGQQATPPPKASDEVSKDDVLRVTTNLVQVDAIVLDKQGKLIPGLKPEDFVLTEDGHPRPITSFSFVSIKPVSKQALSLDRAPASIDRSAPFAVQAEVNSQQARRSIALVVDDISLSFESIYQVRRALRKFVNEQLLPNDMVTILRTSGGSSQLQQFTNDKRQLAAVIDKLEINSQVRPGIRSISTDEAIDYAKQDLDAYRNETLTVATIGALNYIVNGLRSIPGRKSIVLLSDSLPLFTSAAKNSRLLDPLKQLSDQANRNSVNIYTLSVIGLPTLNASAADGNLGGGVSSALRLAIVLPRRFAEFRESQAGLEFLAKETGGLFIRNLNDINQGLQHVLDEQEGYYLIGYRPEENTIDPVTGFRGAHNVKVGINRTDLVVRARTGFYSPDDKPKTASPRTRDQQLWGALTSPFDANGINLRLTTLFGHDQRNGSYFKALLNVDSKNLKFTEEPHDLHLATLDILAVMFGEGQQIIDRRSFTEKIHLRGDEYRAALINGFAFQLDIPVSKAGDYQLRIAVRDAIQEQVGSVSEFVQIPDLDQGHLTLSGIYLAGKNANEKNPSDALVSGNHEHELESRFSAAVRQFLRGMTVDYGCEIYNTGVDKKNVGPPLQLQVRLYYDNKEIYASLPSLLEVSGKTQGVKQPALIGHLQLGSQMPLGEYVLQVIVTDKSAPARHQLASQSINFQIVAE